MRMIATALTIVSLSGCYYDSEEVLYPETFCDLNSVTWSGTIEPIIAGECALPGCHVPGGDGAGHFTSYAGVKAKVEDGSFQQQVLVQRTMPPSGSLTDCELQQIMLWVQAGAPQN